MTNIRQIRAILRVYPCSDKAAYAIRRSIKVGLHTKGAKVTTDTLVYHLGELKDDAEYTYA